MLAHVQKYAKVEETAGCTGISRGSEGMLCMEVLKIQLQERAISCIFSEQIGSK